MARIRAGTAEGSLNVRTVQQPGGWSIVISGRNDTTPLGNGKGNAATRSRDTLILNPIELGEDPGDVHARFTHGGGSRRAREVSSAPHIRYMSVPNGEPYVQVSGEFPLYIPPEQPAILSFRNEGIDAFELALNSQTGVRRGLDSDLGNVPLTSSLEDFVESPTLILPKSAILWATGNWKTKDGIWKRLQAAMLWVRDWTRDEVKIWRDEFDLWGETIGSALNFIKSSFSEVLVSAIPSMRKNVVATGEAEQEPTYTFTGHNLVASHIRRTDEASTY